MTAVAAITDSWQLAQGIRPLLTSFLVMLMKNGVFQACVMKQLRALAFSAETSSAVALFSNTTRLPRVR